MTDRTWTGDLAELRETLTTAAWGLKGDWAWRLLESGVLVALRIRAEDFRKELRTARKEMPTSTTEWWSESVKIAEELGAGKWPPIVAGPDIRYLEPEPYSEVKKHKTAEVPCADCGEPTHPDKAFSVQRCTRCAMKAGQAEAQANNQRRS